MKRSVRRTPGEDGAALLTAVFFVALISLMAALILSAMHIRTLTLERQADRIEAGFLADTARAFAVLSLRERRNDTPPISELKCNLADGVIEISIEDEAGKIDLNTGRLDLLEAVFEVLGRPDLYVEVVARRREGDRYDHIEELLSEDANVLSVLERTVTVHSQLAGVDSNSISTHPDARLLRDILEAVEVAPLVSPRRVFRVHVSVRARGGLEYGELSFIRFTGSGSGVRTLGSFPTPPTLSEADFEETRACRRLRLPQQ